MTGGLTAPTVALLGAHSAQGRALIEVLQERDLDEFVVAATTSEHIEPDLELIDAPLLSKTDIAVLCDDDSLVMTVGETLQARGVKVIDMAGTLSREKVPLVFPGLRVGAQRYGAEVESPRTVRLPVGMVEPVVAVLHAIARFKPVRAEIVTLESAATRGRPGMEELSQQTRGIYTMIREDPSVFAHSLAFACVPSVARPEQSAEEAELEFETDVQAGMADFANEVEVGVTRVLVPSFSAEAATLAIGLQDTPTRSDVTQALADGRGLRVIPDDVGSTLNAVGRDDVLVTRIRTTPRGMYLFIAADRLRRGSATQAALLVERYVDNLSRGP